MPTSPISDRTSPNSISRTRAVNSRTVRVGGWLFRHRTVIPVPFAVALLAVPTGATPSSTLLAAGVVLTSAGELLRLWAVHYIGVISRTRSDRLGPLVAAGPFAFVRNPLYLGNIALWAGMALTAQLAWMAPIFILVLGAEYHAIVQWEEGLLASRLGDAYRDYAARVPRWVPTIHHAVQEGRNPSDRTSAGPEAAGAASFSWRETLFSERGTLMAIATGYVLLWMKLKA
jgi:protein-S-isoprenylcysteine O-methyltransferase Ste14